MNTAPITNSKTHIEGELIADYAARISQGMTSQQVNEQAALYYESARNAATSAHQCESQGKANDARIYSADHDALHATAQELERVATQRAIDEATSLEPVVSEPTRKALDAKVARFAQIRAEVARQELELRRQGFTTRKFELADNEQWLWRHAREEANLTADDMLELWIPLAEQVANAPQFETRQKPSTYPPAYEFHAFGRHLGTASPDAGTLHVATIGDQVESGFSNKGQVVFKLRRGVAPRTLEEAQSEFSKWMQGDGNQIFSQWPQHPEPVTKSRLIPKATAAEEEARADLLQKIADESTHPNLVKSRDFHQQLANESRAIAAKLRDIEDGETEAARIIEPPVSAPMLEGYTVFDFENDDQPLPEPQVLSYGPNYGPQLQIKIPKVPSPTLYARRETTTDETTLTHWVKGQPLPKDTVFYLDSACTQRYAIHPWYYSSCPRKGRKTYNCNSIIWRLVWC